jgi:hypothetical protein
MPCWIEFTAQLGLRTSVDLPTTSGRWPPTPVFAMSPLMDEAVFKFGVLKRRGMSLRTLCRDGITAASDQAQTARSTFANGPTDSGVTLQLIVLFGGAERDRTADLLVANEALSQLSYSPTKSTV